MRILSLILLFAATASAQAGKIGHAGKIGTSGMFTTNNIIIPGSAIPLSDAPIAGTCSTQYEGFYQLGLYVPCTNTPPTNYATEMATLTSTITALNTSGVPCSGSGCKVVLLGGGMSVALAECSSFASAAGTLTQVRISCQAVSNNDSDTWSTPCGATSMVSFRQSCAAPGNSALWGVGVYPDPCQSTVGGSSSGSAQCPAQGLPSATPNQGDRIVARLPTSGLSYLQVQSAWYDTANGTLHPYLQGCLSSGFQVTAVYSVCSPLNGTQAINTEANQNTIDATNIEAQIAQTARDMKRVFPNLVQFWMGGRITAINCVSGCANPEPLDFQISLAVRDLVRAQACELGDYSCTPGTIDPNVGDVCPKPVSCGGTSVANAAPGLLLMDVQASVSHDGNAHSGMFWTTRNNAVPPQPVAQLEDSTVFFCNGETSSPCLGAVDFGADGIHLSAAGGTKAGNIMLRVFQNSPYSQPWFF